MSDASGYQKLPPGWDCKYDQTTGNCYYINYFTKAMQLEDPRQGNYKQLQNERCSTESIALQPMVSNSSPYHVYPSNNLTAIRAFQERHQQPTLNNISTSPLLSASSRGHLVEMSSPLPFQRSRPGANLSRRSTIQETSFTNQIDTDAVVSKIQNMFPTAGENHIRLLLKRYYNREAVVISALQVEKHPVTMPGPFVTPPAQRHLFHSNSAFYMTPPARRLDMSRCTSRTASPLPLASSSVLGAVHHQSQPGGRFGSLMSMQSGGGAGGGHPAPGYGHLALGGAAAAALHGSPQQWRSSPKPHSSPKMKLRYMKNIFPKADEMLLLDVLANADNNVQFASEKLISLGYTKRDMQQPHKPNNRPPQLAGEDQNGTGEDKTVQHIPLRPKEYTEEEKANMQSLLMEKYPQIAERIILMALESVNYAEDRAVQILQIVQDEEEQRAASANQKMKKNLDLSSQALSGVDGLEQVDGQQALDSHQSVVTTKPLHKQRHHHHQQQHHVLPSINVTTPSTFTTQIILSQSMANLDKDKQEEKPPPTASSATSTSLSSYASPAQSPSKCYERLTTKGILARTFGGSSNSNNNSNQSNTKNYYNSNNNYSISGYLHGSCNHSNASSYSNSNNNTTTTTTTDTTNTSSSSSSSMASSSTLATANENRSRLKTDSLKHRDTSLNLNNSQNTESTEFQSIIERMATLGPNSQLTKGADENLLLADYVTWNGPNTTLCQKQSTVGSDPKLLGERGYKPTGRNTELCKGAKANLAKGSIYARGGTKCN